MEEFDTVSGSLDKGFGVVGEGFDLLAVFWDVDMGYGMGWGIPKKEVIYNKFNEMA
jgi:hypothetical protein